MIVLVGRSWKVSLQSSDLIKGSLEKDIDGLGMVAHACDSRISETETGSCIRSLGPPGLCSEMRATARLRGGRQLRELLCFGFFTMGGHQRHHLRGRD